MFTAWSFLIIAIASSIVTINILIGITEIKSVKKIAIAASIFIGWLGVIPVHWIKKYDLLSDKLYFILEYIFNFWLVFVFVLFVVLLLRDIIWYIISNAFKLEDKIPWDWNPNNKTKLNKTNIITIFVCFLICLYASWQAHKLPIVENKEVYSDKITGNLNLIQVSDLYLSRTSSETQLEKLIIQINSLRPDVVVFTGDIINDKIEKVEPLIKKLQQISAPYGLYAVMGDNEFRNNVYEAKKLFERNRIKFLFNGGITIKSSNIFISGIPDYITMIERINLHRTIYKSDTKSYRVLLSHSPIIIDALSKEIFDFVFAGHTLGGQFFPIHWFVKRINKYLCGNYKVNGIEMFVSKGVGAFGPKMRLFAPADIASVNFRSK